MNFNRLIDHGRRRYRIPFNLSGKNFSRKLRGVSRPKGTRISNESTSRVFFGFGNPERLIRRVYGVKLSTIQTSSATRLFLSFVVRFQRFSKRENEGFGARKISRRERSEKEREREKKERGGFLLLERANCD